MATISGIDHWTWDYDAITLPLRYHSTITDCDVSTESQKIVICYLRVRNCLVPSTVLDTSKYSLDKMTVRNLTYLVKSHDSECEICIRSVHTFYWLVYSLGRVVAAGVGRK